MSEKIYCSKCDKEIAEEEVFEFEGEELKPYCETCYSAISEEFNMMDCVLCGKQFSMGNNGNELGFCENCINSKDFPYDLDKYYKDYEKGKVAFKGIETMKRGILKKYKK